MSSAIRAVVLLPPRDLPALGGEVAALLRAYAAERAPEIQLVFAEQEGTAADRGRSMRELVGREEPLALVASFTDGADAELAAVADDLRVPLLATLSSHPRSSVVSHHWVRDLCGGVIEQSCALLRCAGAKNAALVHADDAVARRVPGVRPFDARTVAAQDLDGFDAIVFAGADPAMPRVFTELASPPKLLLAGAALPPALFDRGLPASGVWLALPSCPRDESPFAVAAYRELVRRHDIPTAHRMSQYAALTSLQLFLDALRRCAGTVTRDALLAAIDDTRAFHSGLLPSLTYGEQRHIGSTGAWVFAMHDPNGGAVWVESDE
jgi:hypothetical protein